MAFLEPRIRGCSFPSFKLNEAGKFAPSTSSPVDGPEWVESMLSIETKFGRGKGMLRLVQGDDGIYKGYMLYTSLPELKGFEENSGARRPHGGNNSFVGRKELTVLTIMTSFFIIIDIRRQEFGQRLYTSDKSSRLHLNKKEPALLASRRGAKTREDDRRI
ncbi:uncharacterized protein Z518_00210 [Rhinocladiella mackenziei CBS 650.93]|uniref:Uncharacterized protein n=1 Tax=Rhinocladiella mackenziei CBS 650.93 TaxID=1442369 RepID=A0A0D2G3H8_9EURO|nr:uncharacterized protein Z518_00210 [Rhinocladiella mackenziei CBS 650.93]KIX09132.1 hypothetical protein Z518_00210 [Rhinocladiella mackenziei CBS 650.93]